MQSFGVSASTPRSQKRKNFFESARDIWAKHTDELTEHLLQDERSSQDWDVPKGRRSSQWQGEGAPRVSVSNISGHVGSGQQTVQEEYNCAVLMVHDAIMDETDMYYTKDDHRVGTLWACDETAVTWALRTRYPWMRNTYVVAAFLRLLIVMPTLNPVGGTAWILFSIKIVILAMFGFAFFMRLRFMWPSRTSWFDPGVTNSVNGTNEIRWFIIFGVVLLFDTITTVVCLGYGITSLHKLIDGTMVIEVIDTSHSTLFRDYSISGDSMNFVYPPDFNMVVMIELCCIFFPFYFCTVLRRAFSSLLDVTVKLFPTMLLVLLSNIGCLFIINLVMGDTSIQALHDSGFGKGANSYDGLWSLYVLMTTANHPDVLMPLVNWRYLTFFIIVAYMVVSNLMLLNLLLAVVSDEYNSHIEWCFKLESNKRLAMLDTAFEALSGIMSSSKYGDPRRQVATRPSEPVLYASELREVLWMVTKHCNDDLHKKPSPKLQAAADQVVGWQKLDFEGDEIEWCNLIIMALCRGKETLNNESFRVLTSIYTVNVEMKDWNSLSNRFAAAVEYAESLEREGKALGEIFDQEQSDRTKSIKETCKLREKEEPSYLDESELNLCTSVGHGTVFRSTAFEDNQSASVAEPAGDWKPPPLAYLLEGKHVWGSCFPKLAYLVKHKLRFRLPLWGETYINFDRVSFTMIALSVIAGLSVTQLQQHESLLSTVYMVFAVYFTFEVMCQSLAQSLRWCKHNYIKKPESWVDIASAGLAIYAAVDSVISSGEKQAVSTQQLLSFARICRVCYLVKKVRWLAVVVHAMQIACLSAGPQLGLLLIIYEAFIILGIGLFCGKTTQVVEDGGPGYWETAPYNTTQYGEDAYYYLLNFDDTFSSFATLFVCMIQNNWMVVVSGFSATTSKYARLYFLAYNIIVATVMMNIFTGVLIDTVQQQREDLDVDSQGNSVSHRVRLALQKWLDNKLTRRRLPLSLYWAPKRPQLTPWNSLRVELALCFLESAEDHAHHDEEAEIARKQEVKQQRQEEMSDRSFLEARHVLSEVSYVLDAMEDLAVWVRREDGMIVFCNKAFAHIAGCILASSLQGIYEQQIFEQQDLDLFNTMADPNGEKDSAGELKGSFCWDDRWLGQRDQTTERRWLVRFLQVDMRAVSNSMLHGGDRTFLVWMRQLGPLGGMGGTSELSLSNTFDMNSTMRSQIEKTAADMKGSSLSGAERKDSSLERAAQLRVEALESQLKESKNEVERLRAQLSSRDSALRSMHAAQVHNR